MHTTKRLSYVRMILSVVMILGVVTASLGTAAIPVVHAQEADLSQGFKPALASPGASNLAQMETGTSAADILTVQAVQNLDLDAYGRIVDVTFSQSLDSLDAPWDRFRFDIEIVQPLAHDSGAFLGDLNDDGVLDMILADWDGHRLFFPGRADSPRLFGDGIMLKETQAGISSDPYEGEGGDWIGGDIGDIDNDGDNEIVIGRSVYKNVGTLTEPKLDYQYSFSGVGGWDPTTSLGDLNGDGKLDAAVSTNYASGGNFICWNNSTPGTISFSGCTELLLASAKTKAIGDLNGDGLLDLADEDGIYFNQGTALNPVFPGTGVAWNVSGGAAWDGQYDMSMNISLRDNNGDGLLDAYLSKVGATAWQVLYYENVGTDSSPQFQYVGPVVATSTPMNFANRMYTDSGTMGLPRDAHLTTEDIDSNGSPDILLSPIWNGEWDASAVSTILWGFPASVGNMDIYSYQDLYTYPPKARINSGCGVGTWDPKDFLCSPPTIFGAWTDLNNDGLSDAIRVGLDYDEDMTSYYGLYSRIRTGTWPFTTSTEVPFQTAPSGNQGRGGAITVTDVNLDGRSDLVIGQEDGTLLYYQNTISGFADPVPLSDSLGSPIDVGDQASPVAIDLNGDENIDFLVANYDGTIHKVLNMTPGSPQGYLLGELLGATEQNPVDIVHVVGGGWLSPTLGTSDIDKDGLVDVLMGDESGQVWLLHNIGDQSSASFSLNAFNVSNTTAAYMEKLDASHYRLYFALPTVAYQTKLGFHLPLSSGEVVISGPPQTLSVGKSGTGSGTVTSNPAGINCGADCTEDYAGNISVTLTASAATGSTFTGWSGACTGTEACVVSMTAAQSVTANFAVNMYTLNVDKSGIGSGSVTSFPVGINCGADCAEDYAYNTSVTLMASAATGSTFTGWSGACTGTGVCVVSMTAARSVTATFTVNTYALTISKSGAGSGTVTSDPVGIDCGLDCTEAYNYNTLVTLTAGPATGSTFGGWSGACTGTGSCIVNMIAARAVTATFNLMPPGPATLVSPTGNVTTNTPTYVWNKVSGATYYYLWVDGSSGNMLKQWYTTAQAACGETTCSVTPTTTLSSGAYTWKVQTYNSAGYGPWSNILSFNTPLPPEKATLLSPSGSTTATPTYTWNEVNGATYYLLQVNGPSGNVIKTWYTPVQANCAVGGICSVTPTSVLSAGAYSWWIQTWNPAGYGPWSDRMDFTVPAPPLPGQAILSGPNGDITTNAPTYTWTATSDTTWYYLYVNGPSGNVIKQWYDAAAICSEGTCSVTPTTTLSAGAHKWWIQTWGPTGYGPWSDTMDFTVALPGKAILSDPTGSISDTTPDYTWSAVEGATWYYLYVNGPSGAVIKQWYDASLICSDDTCTITPTTTLGSGAHSWWVQSWSPIGYGSWSDRMDFTVP